MVTTIPRYEERIRPYFTTGHADMLRVMLNSTSNVEANLALQILLGHIPKKSLVTAANLREAIKELPRCPIPMAFDFDTLAGVWDLTPLGNSWKRTFKDPLGDYEIVLMGKVNYCYDIAILTEDGTALWSANDPKNDFINTPAIDLVMSRDTLLKTVVDLVQTMGLPFSPTFYLSLEDWHLEHAESIFAELENAFSRGHASDDPLHWNERRI